MNATYDAIIIGAGASGLMCAYTAAKRGKKVLLLDHSPEIGRKILISGGGKCNFSNREINEGCYVSENPHFVKSALARFGTKEILDLFEKNGIEWFDKGQGQLFCKRSSKDVVDLFSKSLKEHNVKVMTDCEIKTVNYVCHPREACHPRERGDPLDSRLKHAGMTSKGDDYYETITTKGNFKSSKVVIATGGLSYAALGATGFGYKMAKKFGHTLISTRPALVPLLLNENDLKYFGKLSGVSVKAKVCLGKGKFEGDMLFTHKGLSGPVILNASLFWKKGDLLIIDLTGSYIPNRLAKTLSNFLNSPKKSINSFEMCPKAAQSYDYAEVTVGGIDTNEISSKTFESKKAEGVYFIGEVLDVTGLIGGYNLHFAFASGHAAGLSL